VAKIKDLLDALKALQHFIKPLLGNGDESGKDEKFYGEFTALWDELNKITSLYNMVRNYMTRKPYSEEKIKLNFQNSTLMDGWDYNKERDNTAVILRKDGLYYLGIMNKKYNKIFEPENVKHDGECFEKMIYKLLPGANKMLPKVFFSKSRIDEFKPSKEIVENYKNDTHKKGEKFNIEDCHRLIDFFKSSIEKHSDWSKFNFKFSDTSKYADLSGFYREVEHQGYKVTFVNISKDYVNSLVDEGKLYLFQIYNKDFSPYSKGTPNMHTLYWKMLFDERNLDNVVYKLNGQAEIFYRKKSINYDRPTHPAHQPIANKNIQNRKKESLFKYDLIKNRRYTVDKFLFHVPITINFKGIDSENINDQVRRYLQKAKDTHVIGIDRGERNLLYLVVVDNKGNIVEQYSLNNIVNEYKGNTYSTDYHALLDANEKERELARESWQTIENIKELKEGYLSQVIHKITELMIKYHAIVVLEDLNMGFKRGRQKVEKQVYQKFEKQLIDKLNYVVDKHKAPEADGGLLHAYQLTSKFDSFQKLGKQSGFLFYIPAWNTSKIDPVTGFVNLFDTRYVNIEKAKAFFCKFDIIRYNQDKEWFEFGFDYKNFTSKADESRTKWTLCTFGTRVETFRNKEKNSQWDNRNVDLTKAFKELFSKYNIDLSSNIKEAICIQTEKDFFESLLHLLKLTLQMRNSVTGTEIDYIISPVANGNGEFFDSRTCSDKLPKDADANGAYNIARKGLMLIEQIKKSKDLKKLKFDISNKSWLQYVQNN
jgi:CRISPR-associated protein Cpf1